MHTSYYANPKLREVDPARIVAISLIPPFVWGQNGERECPGLAPTASTLFALKQGKIDEAEYERRFREELRDRFEYLDQIYDLWNELGDDAILVCFERPEKFCHRHIVAAWLKENLNLDVTEWDYPPKRVKEKAGVPA